jgi:hypothetical protein
MRVNLGAFWQDWGQIIPTVWKQIEGPVTTLLKYQTDIKQAKYAYEMGQAFTDAQRAQAEAQARAISAQMALATQQQQAKEQVTLENWKKLAPYAIAVAGALVIVAILLITRKER